MCLDHMDLKNKKVTVIGLARSGQATVELALRLGARVKISEAKTQVVSSEQIDAWRRLGELSLEWGGHTPAFIEDSDMIVLSPGVPRQALPLEWARAKGIPIFGEVEFSWRFCPAPVIAITGSNGKTTVTTLIAQVLKRAGKRVCLCGNIGTPLAQYVLGLSQEDWVVMEVSSFQLETISDFRPHIAVFLNFSQNHLDRHKDLEEYWEAKKRIFMNQTEADFAVVNARDPALCRLAPALKSQVIFFEGQNPNQAAVRQVARILDISEDCVAGVLADFKGVEHRLERVRQIAQVVFINDSKSTTAESGRWALESLSGSVIMICGGKDKNIDFSSLKPVVRQKVRRMIVIGEARKKLQSVFGEVTEVLEADSLQAAVLTASREARPGESVVLSPMCASFDMFANFEERGRIFKEIVQSL